MSRALGSAPTHQPPKKKAILVKMGQDKDRQQKELLEGSFDAIGTPCDDCYTPQFM